MIEPSVSVPMASGATPAETAAADPDEDPPALRAGSHGLRVRPPLALQPLVEFGDRMRREGKLSGMTTDEIMEMNRGPYDDVEPR